jgi:hypothetical protein
MSLHAAIEALRAELRASYNEDDAMTIGIALGGLAVLSALARRGEPCAADTSPATAATTAARMPDAFTPDWWRAHVGRVARHRDGERWHIDAVTFDHDGNVRVHVSALDNARSDTWYGSSPYARNVWIEQADSGHD